MAMGGLGSAAQQDPNDLWASVRGWGGLGVRSSPPAEPQCLPPWLRVQVASRRGLPVSKQVFCSEKEFLASVGVSRASEACVYYPNEDLK